MAQVTMTSQEYLELIDKARQLEKLEQEMVESVEITLDPEGSYSKYNVNIVPVFTADATKKVIKKIVDTIKDADYVMDNLASNNSHFLRLSTGWISYNWNEKPEEGEVDLLTDKEFKAAWDAAKARACKESEQEEE